MKGHTKVPGVGGYDVKCAGERSCGLCVGFLHMMAA